MRLPLRKTVATLALCAFIPLATAGQQPSQSNPRAAIVAAKVATLRAGSRISILPLHKPERYGIFESSRPENFTFHDVDQKVDVTLTYAEVKKVKDGYGGYNSVSQKHTDRTRAYIAIGIVAGLIVGVIVAVAAAKN